jgi:hypothetical protein
MLGVRRVAGWFRGDGAHVGDELMAAASDGRDEPLAERTAQRRDHLIEIVLLDDRRGPERIEENGPGNQLAGMLDEMDEGIERLAGKRHALAVRPSQRSTPRVEAEPAELVYAVRV